MNGSKIKETAMQNKDVVLMNLKTFLYLMCFIEVFIILLFSSDL